MSNTSISVQKDKHVPSYRDKILSEFIELINQRKNCKIAGTIVFDYMKNNTFSNNDIDMIINCKHGAAPSLITAIKNKLGFCFDIKELDGYGYGIITNKFIFKYKFQDNLLINIDIIEDEVDEENKILDLDIEGLYIVSKDNFYISHELNYKLVQFIDRITKKKFRIMRKFKIPSSRRKMSNIDTKAIYCILYKLCIKQRNY